MYLNLGIKTFNYEDFKKTNNYSIFAACEAKEAIAQLKMVPTINPVEKSKKGIKGTGKKDNIPRNRIKIMVLRLDLKILQTSVDGTLWTFDSFSSHNSCYFPQIYSKTTIINNLLIG